MPEVSMMQVLRGIGASDGVAIGPAVVIDNRPIEVPDLPDASDALVGGLETVARQLEDLRDAAAEAGRAEASEVLGAQALIAEDPMLRESVTSRLDGGVPLGRAIDEAVAEIEAIFAAIDDPYIAARATDVGEVVDRLRRILAGVAEADISSISEPAVLIAPSITTAETAQLDADLVLGFATEVGGPTSHVAIIARSLGVPAVVGVEGLASLVESGDRVALDGATGQIAVSPDDPTLEGFESAKADHQAVVAAATSYKGRAAAVGDSRLTVAANVGSVADLERAVEEQADGIGLFRTEFLFLDRSSPPSEEEQVEVYSMAAAAFDEPVVIRAFDIGGDKPASYISPPDEENPFLGVRGARLYQEYRELFETQVRAVVRAAALGDVWLMLPMVSTVAEVLELGAVVDTVVGGLEREGQPVGRPKLGVMVEVPSVALIADTFADHVDFFSIGTNDLTQYTLAADRTNGALDHLQDPLHPSVLALCMFTAAAARRKGISVSVCGLAAADPAGAALFAGMGIDKLSVSTTRVNRIKAVLDRIDPDRLERVVGGALAASDATAVRGLVDELLTEA